MSRNAAIFRFAASGLAFCGLLAIPAPSHAYKMEYPPSSSTSCASTAGTGLFTSMCGVACDNTAGFAHWTSHNVSWRLNTAGPGFDKAAAIQAALASWSSVPNATYSLSYGGTTTNTGFSYDGVNTMSWGDADAFCNPNLCHAITGVYVSGGETILDVDILFNSSSALSLDWRTDGAADPCKPVVTGNRVDTQAIATHELGHSLGIYHPLMNEPSYLTATMGGVSCNAEGRSLSSDDQAALVCSDNRYPQSPSYEGYSDVANCSTLSGWAWNSNRPNQSAYVDIKDGSTTIRDVEANLYRSDLVSAGKGNGYHGYSISTPSSLKNGLIHHVGAQFSGNGVNLIGSPKDIACSAYIFSGLFPDYFLSTGGQVYTVATRFTSNLNGTIKQLKYYKAPGESGTSTLRLWTDSGTQLASGDVSSCSGGGWCFVSLSPAVSITAGAYYRVGVNTNVEQSKTDCGIGAGITRGPLTATNSYWIAGNTFPTTSSCSNFFVDVLFDSL